VSGAAAYLGAPVSFVRRLVLERRVRYYKLGKYLRFDPVDLDNLVAATRVDPIPDSRLTTPAAVRGAVWRPDTTRWRPSRPRGTEK
jgi:excisionase family DNA binding protein